MGFIGFIFITGFLIRFVCSVVWWINKDYGYTPTKSQAKKFYLIPFYWMYWVTTYIWNEVFD